MINRVNLKSLAFYLLVPIMLYFIVSMLVGDVVPFYNSLVKPFPDLPYLVFPLFWSLMHLVSGLAGYFTENAPAGETAPEEQKRKALRLFMWQLLLSLLWLPLVFGFRLLLFGFLLTVLLAGLIFVIRKKFQKIAKPAGYLMIPYLIWTVFLAYYLIGMYLLS